MKRDRSAEPGADSGTASNRSNPSPEKTLDEFAHFEQEEACGADVTAGCSSKKSKTMNQECIKDKPQGIKVIEDSSSSSETKAAESVMIIEKLNCKSMEGECEEKLERDTVEDKEEVSPRSLLLHECLSHDSVPFAVSSPKAKLSVPTGPILAKDIASTVIAEESTKSKDETLIYAPESELKEHSSIAKLANVEEILETSTERWKEIHSSKDDEKGSFKMDVQAENLHGNVSECNTENSSADEEMEISKIGVMSVAHCVNLIPEKLLGEYPQLEPEEAGRPNEGASSSSQKMKKTEGQEFVKDKPQEPVVISENVLDPTQKVSGDTSAVRNSHELNSELLEEGREERHEQSTTKKDNGEASSSLSELLIERSEVKTCPDNRIIGCSLSVETTLPPALVQLAMRNPEADLGLPTGDDVVSAVITEEDKITKEETLIFTPASEHKEHSSVAELAKVEAILGNSAECCKDDEKGSLEKEVQAENLQVNFSECNTENSSAEEEMEIIKDSCMSSNLTPEKLLDTYTQLVPEEAGEPNVEIRSSSKKVKTVSSECLKGNEDSPSTSVTKTTETIMMSENDLDSTSRVSVGFSLVRNPQELNEEREEKQEQDMVLIPLTKKDKEEASSLSKFLTERPEVSISEAELFVETTPPPSSVQLAVRNLESELSVGNNGHVLVNDTVSAVIAEEDIKTEEVPKSVHSFVAKLAETDVLEKSAECWNESLSSKDDERGSLEKEKQSAKRHGNFSEYNAENSSAEEEADICKVGRISDGHCVNRETLDVVKDESLMKSVQTISSERGCKPNALELSGSLSTELATHSHKENVSECLEEDEMKALSQPIPIKKAASNVLDKSSLFTTPERNLMLVEQQLSESGKICAAHIVTQQNDEAAESHAVVFTTPEKVLLLGDSGLDEVGQEEEHTTTDFPDNLNTTQNEAFNEEERIVVKLHYEPNIAASPLRQSSVGNFKEDRTERNEENGTVELHCESGTCTGPDKHAALANFVSDGEENSGGNKAIEFYEESVVFTGPEERHELFGNSGQEKDREGAVKKAAQIHEEAGLSTELADPECEVGWLGINNADESGRVEGHFLYGDSDQKKAEKAPAEFHDESELEEAAKSEENKALELQADCDNFTAVNTNAKSHDMSDVLTASESRTLLKESELEEAARSEENKAVELQVNCDNFTGVSITAKSHGMSDVHTASDSHSLMGDFEPDEEENKDVELLGESNISTDVERHLLSEELRLAETRKIKHNTTATCEESFLFISPERRQQLGNSEPHTAGKQERKEVEFKDESAFFTRLETRLLLGESGQDRLDNVKSGSAQYQSHRASSPTVSYSHEIDAEEESAAGAEFVGLDAMQGTSKQSRGNSSPHVDSVNHFDFDTMGAADTIMDAYVLALPAEGNSETTGEISNHIEVAGTCSLVSSDKDISLTSDESTLQKNKNEEAADEEMVATPNPEDTLNESYDNIGESGTSSEEQVRRESVLIYRTQAKPKRHDMKENAPNSKIVDALNVTAPRTSKRQPLQDLRKN